MKKIPSDSIDLILCDLPYGSTKCKWDSIIDIPKLWIEYKRILKNHMVLSHYLVNNLLHLCLFPVIINGLSIILYGKKIKQLSIYLLITDL